MFFTPPKDIETSVFATLPDIFRDTARDNEWAFGQAVAKPAPVLEGPSFDLEGNLYCVDVPGGRIFCVSPAGSFELVVEYDGWPNGLKIASDGRIFVADYKHGIMLLDPVAKRIRPFVTRYHLERFKGVNDLFIASNGDIYFTDQGMSALHDPTGRLFRASNNGRRVECLLDNIPSPNGVVMNVDESCVFVAVTRANSIWRVQLRRDGSRGKVGNFIQLSGGGGPDGLAIDEQGRLAIAHVGLGTVWVFDALGEPVWRVRSTVGTHTTNLAFGGPDRKSLFITEATSGSILRAELDVPGKAMASHMDLVDGTPAS